MALALNTILRALSWVARIFALAETRQTETRHEAEVDDLEQANAILTTELERDRPSTDIGDDELAKRLRAARAHTGAGD